MPADVELREQAPLGYRLIRGLIRLWFTLFSETIRLLNLEVVPDSAAAILVVTHPVEWGKLLRLVAAFPRPLRCVAPRALFPSLWRRGLARALGVVGCEPESANWAQNTDRYCGALGDHELVVAFAEARSDGLHTFYRDVAAMALEAEARYAGQLDASLFTVHLLAPQAGAPVTETMIHVDGPLLARDYLSAGGVERSSGVDALAAEMERRSREHAFCLQPEAVARLRDSLEAALKADLEDSWLARLDGKQTVDGFRLNALASRWVEQTSYTDPGQIMALLELLDRYREERRRWALTRLEAETAGGWLESPLRRVVAWAETLAGLPLAAYGFINHCVIGVILLGTGWFKHKDNAGRAAKWLLAGLVALIIYGLQIFIVGRLAGRAAAGYYAPSLPLSAAYLWRYRWLLRHRTRLLFVSLRMPRQAAVERRRRKAVIACFERAFRRSAEAGGEKM